MPSPQERLGPIVDELRWSISALSGLDHRSSLYDAHLEVILAGLARRLDELERRIDQLTLKEPGE